MIDYEILIINLYFIRRFFFYIFILLPEIYMYDHG